MRSIGNQPLPVSVWIQLRSCPGGALRPEPDRVRPVVIGDNRVTEAHDARIGVVGFCRQ